MTFYEQVFQLEQDKVFTMSRTDYPDANAAATSDLHDASISLSPESADFRSIMPGIVLHQQQRPRLSSDITFASAYQRSHEDVNYMDMHADFQSTGSMPSAKSPPQTHVSAQPTDELHQEPPRIIVTQEQAITPIVAKNAIMVAVTPSSPATAATDVDVTPSPAELKKPPVSSTKKSQGVQGGAFEGKCLSIPHLTHVVGVSKPPTNTSQKASNGSAKQKAASDGKTRSRSKPTQKKLSKAAAPPKSAGATSSKKAKKHNRQKTPLPKRKNGGRRYLNREPNIHDIKMGRGGGTNKHKGNVLYLLEKLKKQAPYVLVATKKGKTVMSQELVNLMRKKYGSRFVALDKRNGLWYEVTNAVARNKASQTLREDKTPEKQAEKRSFLLRKLAEIELNES